MIIPASRTIDWTQVGIPGGIPSYPIFGNVRTGVPGLNILASGDGINDEFLALQGAINLCPVGRTIYIPSGLYKLTGALTYSKGINLSGDGISTIISGIWTGSSTTCISIGSSTLLHVNDIVSGYVKGSSVVYVNNLTGSFATGKLLLIDQLNDGTFVSNSGGEGWATFVSRSTGSRGIQQTVEITGFFSSAAGQSGITFRPPLFWDYSGNLVPQASVHQTSATKYAGIENLRLIDDGDSFSPIDRSIVQWVNSAYGWMKNVKTENCFTAHVYANRILRCEFRRNFPTGAKVWSSNNSYGYRFGLACSSNLFEDNILGILRGALILEYGSAGNVVGYNYSLASRNDTTPTAQQPSYQPSHGAHPMMNLFEGNVGPKFESDFTWGTSSHNTLFRNAFSGISSSFTQLLTAIDIQRGSTYFNIVGNVIGTPKGLDTGIVIWPASYLYDNTKIGIRFGYAGDAETTGNGANDAYNTAIVHGNYDYFNSGVVWDSGIADQSLPASYYLTSKPTWFGTLTWPNVNPSTGNGSLVPYVGMNPAQYRYSYNTDFPMQDIISPSRLPPSGTGLSYWQQYAGIPGGIPNTSSWTITPINGLDTTGGAAINDIVATAINAAAPRTVLTIGTGTFLVTGRIALAKNNIVLRGAKDASYINLNKYQNIDTGNCTVFRISGISSTANAGVFGGISSTFRQPASVTGTVLSPTTSGVIAEAGITGVIVTAAQITGFQLNKMARIFQQNYSGIPVVQVDMLNNMQGQMVMVRSTGAYMVGFEPPLIFPLYSGQAPFIEPQINVFSGIGVENIFFDGTYQTGQSYHMQFNRAYQSWISGCQFFNAMQYMHYWNGNLQCEARHNTTWLERDSNGTYNHGPNMAGHKLDACTACVVMDNIYYRQFPSIQINGDSSFARCSSAGNVVAYNFSAEAYNANLDSAADYESSHGPLCQYDLYEGNIGDKFSMDAYYGSSMYATVLRNWFGGANPYAVTHNIAVNLGRFTRNYNIVGNILGKSGISNVYILTSGTENTSQKYVYRLSYPNVDSSTFSGSVQPSSGIYWANWNTAAGNGGFQELDLDVIQTTLRKGNYIIGSGGTQPSDEDLGGFSVSPSYIYQTAPNWWPASLTWPPFDQSAPNAVTGATPAGYRFLNGIDPSNSGNPPIIVYVLCRVGRRPKFGVYHAV